MRLSKIVLMYRVENDSQGQTGFLEKLNYYIIYFIVLYLV